MTVSPARLWFGSTAAAALAGLVVQVLVVATAAHSPWSSIPARIFNLFCYFTIQSNAIAGVTCLMLAVNLDRRSNRVAANGVWIAFLFMALAAGLHARHAVAPGRPGPHEGSLGQSLSQISDSAGWVNAWRARSIASRGRSGPLTAGGGVLHHAALGRVRSALRPGLPQSGGRPSYHHPF